MDWTNLSANSFNASVQILSRISAAGIDPFTIVIGQAIGGSLLWRDEGRKRFDEALQACQGLAGYRNMLWFGFGVKHIAYVLTATDQGATCAGLCACLAECYTTAFAAGIMLEMTKLSNPSTESTPSLVQWRNLVSSCAGLVSNSTFGIRAEQLMRLTGELRVASRATNCDIGAPSRGIAHKSSIAEALSGLAKLSRGVLFEMTIIGGGDAGFLAALADWLLGLDVEIRDGLNQEVLFRNCRDEKKPQLLVIYDQGVPKDALQCVGKTYRLPDANHLIVTEDGALVWTLLSGRVPWDEALDMTFSRDFRKLIGMKQSLGTAIGSAARIYQGLYEGDEFFSDGETDWRLDCSLYFPESYGSAYVHFVTTKFPELAPLRKFMASSVRESTIGQSCMNFEASMTSIQQGCGCTRCTYAETERDQQGAFCLVFLTYTILRLSRALSGIVTQLSPMRAGLEIMYDQVLIEHRDDAQKEISVIAIKHLFERTKFDDRNDRERSHLAQAQLIFGGTRGDDTSLGYSGRNPSGWVSAVAINGLCYCLGLLLEPSYGSARAAQVYIVGGRIEHMGRAYEKVTDGGNSPPPLTGSAFGARPDFPRFDHLEKCLGSHLEVLVSERFEGLSVEYGICKDLSTYATFGPANTTQSMCRNEGLVSCGRKGRCNQTPRIRELKEAAEASFRSGKVCCFVNMDQEAFLLVQGNIISRLFAARCTWDPIIQRDECLACCVKSGMMRGLKNITIIMSKDGANSVSRS